MKGIFLLIIWAGIAIILGIIYSFLVGLEKIKPDYGEMEIDRNFILIFLWPFVPIIVIPTLIMSVIPKWIGSKIKKFQTERKKTISAEIEDKK